jgi:hypothetical protein
VARRQRPQNNEVASNSLNESVTNASVSGSPAFLKRQARPLLRLDGPGGRDYGESVMRLLRLLIWLATLFFALMLFLPLVRQIILRLTESGGSALP